MAQDTKAQIAWSLIGAIVLALWAWSFTLSGRLAAVETKTQALEETTRALRSIDQRLSRIEGRLGVAESR